MYAPSSVTDYDEEYFDGYSTIQDVNGTVQDTNQQGISSIKTIAEVSNLVPTDHEQAHHYAHDDGREGTAEEFRDSLDPSAVEYLRIHGLAKDHLAEPIPFFEMSRLQNDISGSDVDDSNLPKIELPLGFSSDERLTVSKDAASLLFSASGSASTFKEIDRTIDGLLDIRNIKKLRVENPILRTDHDQDFRDFAKWEKPNIEDGILPMEPLDEEMDEGLGWPSTWYSLPNDLIMEVQSTKLQIEKKVIHFLVTTMKISWTEDDVKLFWDSTLSYNKNRALEPITPPLLPTYLPSTPHLLSSPTYHLPLLSDPASLVSADLQVVEREIYKTEVELTPRRNDSDTKSSPVVNTEEDLYYIRPADVHLSFDHINSDDAFLTSGNARAKDWKVEVPLTPTTPAIALPRIVTFSEVIEEMLLDPLFSDSSVRDSSPVDAFFQEAFANAAERAIQQIGQESLQEADLTKRVPIPLMNFSLPEPPWKAFQAITLSSDLLPAQQAMIRELKAQYGFPSRLPALKGFEMSLRWSPFPPGLAKVALEESLNDGVSFQPFITSTKDQDVINSAGIAWKPPGLRILKEDEDEDEEKIERGYFVEDKQQDITSLVKKRKLKIDDMLIQPPTSPLHRENVEQEQLMTGRGPMRKHIPKNDSVTAPNTNLADIEEQSESDILLGGNFSAMNALENFLEIRGRKKLKSADGAYFKDSAANIITPFSAPQLPLGTPVSVQPLPVPPKSLPIPKFDVPEGPTSYIISSSLLKRRGLVRIIEHRLPQCTLVERDFTAHNSSMWLSPFSVSRHSVTSCLVNEADLIISSSTGIILTNLTKLQQKPLPGQKAKDPIKDRVQSVAERYERLIVLVSEGVAGDSVGGFAFDGYNSLAMCDFIGFCNSLETTVIVYYISGGEATLGEWLVATMVQFGAYGSDFLLLIDETLWELFLRRAGMNAFAAQDIISRLKAPDGVSTSKGGLFGIDAFVEMGAEERVRRFESIFGGRKVLDRVGRVIDQLWR